MRLWLSAFTFLFIVTACSDSGALSSSSQQNEYIQIMIGNLDSGRVTRDSYRLSQSGDLSRASWTDNNDLLGLSDTINIGSENYRMAVDSLSTVEATNTSQQEGVVSSPPVLTIELVQVRVKGGDSFIFRDTPSDAIDSLVSSWQQLAPLNIPTKGFYSWTLPAPPGSSPEDLVVEADEWELEPNKTVQDGYLGPDVIVIASDAIVKFIENGREGRARYIARSMEDLIYFGVLSSP